MCWRMAGYQANMMMEAVNQKTRSCRSAVLMLVHRLPRWPNMKLTLCQRLVFAGSTVLSFTIIICLCVLVRMIGGPGMVQWLKLPACKVGDSRFEPTLAFKFQSNKMILLRLLVEIQYCGEPLWPRGSVLGLRPPGLKFRILCLEGSVIVFISAPSGGAPGPV